MSNHGTKRLHLFGLANAYSARIGAILLVLTALCLLASTITQRLWTWDRYLHGGHDFETGVLVILVSFCLVLILMHHCKREIDHLAAATTGSLCITDNNSATRGPLRRIAAASHHINGPPSIDRNYCLPLTI